jgi:hypothetical protein
LHYLHIAVAIGAAIDRPLSSHITTLTGTNVPVYPGEIELKFAVGNDVLTWLATMGFIETQNNLSNQPILGHSGFLDNFIVSLDGDRREVTVVPIAAFPGSISAAT